MREMIIAVAISLAASGCSAQYVNDAAPIAVANKFYGALKVGDSKTALAQFSPKFKQQIDNWPRFLGGLQERFGRVTSAVLQSSDLVPGDDGPCYSLMYSVKRVSVASSETLFLCARDGSSVWLIRGHKLTRQDSTQSVSAGLMPTEMTVPVPVPGPLP